LISRNSARTIIFKGGIFFRGEKISSIISILISSGQSESYNRILSILSAQNEFYIVGIEKDETGTIIRSERLQPDILILDLQPHGIGGEELAPIIHRRSPSTFIIMLSDRDDENYACLALKSGITGYLLKEKDIDNLVSVVKIVFSGGYYISASIAIKAINTITLMKQFPGQFLENKEKCLEFSPTERSIVKCVAKGFSDEKIAGYLHLSTGTIRNYMAAIKQKTKTNSRVHAVIFSLVYGLISLEDTGILENQ